MSKARPSKFTPITLEILWRRLISIVDEADATVSRTAFSSLLRDAHDYTFTVYDRYKLFPGAAFPGPTIIEERESTVIVGEDAKVEVDGFGFLWIEMGVGGGG